MNVDISNSKYKVISKYFTGQAVMDESLTDFQEKKSFKVVKNNKLPDAKPKVKKVKRVKGQKDIRTALKQKKNDLIAYSEDFDSVCKKSGIDVDSEQLQLAIALSKSLHTIEPTESSTSCSKSLTAQQRTGLIRTTLKEYGFKVPEKPNASRKTKKRRKPYKLLLTSDEEKQQIITDRYTQRLFELNNIQKTSTDQDLVKSNLLIYNMSTNIEYEDIKDDSVFYVESLIEETPNSMGCMLKKWSNIPGRPLSPQLNKSELIFSEIECSQDEMDIVLSGPLKYSKDILKKKTLFKDKEKKKDCTLIEKAIDNKDSKLETDSIVMENYNLTPEVLSICSDSDDNNANPCKIPGPTSILVSNTKENNLLTQPSRSLSPDLFDEEEDAIVELPFVTRTEIMLKPAEKFTKKESEIMDLTECVNALTYRNSNNSKNIVSVSQLSQPVDITKRKSNDFMEMTECVCGISQLLWKKNDEEIDLTWQCEEVITSEKTTQANSKGADNVDIVGGHSPLKIKKIIDLTAYCENNVETNNATCDDNGLIAGEHIDLTGNCVNYIANEKNNRASADSIENMDLTQSSNSSTDTLPFVHISGKPTVSDKSMEDTIIMNEDDYLEIKSSFVNKDINDSGGEKLDQYVETEANAEDNIPVMSPKNMSIETPIISLDEPRETPAVDDGIDLTQSSESNEAYTNVTNNRSHQVNNSSLGKRDNVSVDYDEALENMNSFPYHTHDEYDDNSITLIEKQTTSNDHIISSKDRQLTTLDITDNELKSPTRINNGGNHLDFGGISVIDNLPSFNSKSRNTMNNMTNGSMSDSLPMVNVKGRSSPGKTNSPIEEFLDPEINSINQQNATHDKPSNTSPQTPQIKENRNINVETPEQSEYIVKTDNVTPMLDYASMSTPERNRELDRYGLKPFKRKRAIQLLTHLYNQTHPYVESTEELTSPSKKRKKSDPSKPSSSKTSSTSTSPRTQLKSPRKTLQSPRKQSISPRKCAGDSENLDVSDKENDLFRMTNEVLAIRNLECDADDWVFQKREKAKLHSCRVPLHIAFHNYVSCRRRLHEAILRYEPVNIDLIHKELAASGHRYDPKDLLKFMDKKCITVKTTDHVKNNKRY